MRRRLTGPDVHSTAQFQEVIRYERARADRAASRFALVSLETREVLSVKRELRRLIRALRRRIRTTDVLGWLDEQTLCVLLPCTDLKGGETFALNFAEQYYRERPPLPFTVYCHPDGWLRGGGSSPRAQGIPIRSEGKHVEGGDSGAGCRGSNAARTTFKSIDQRN